MTQQQILSICRNYVRENCNDDPAAHDWHQIARVVETASKLNESLGADSLIVEMIALLHDVYDHKFYPVADKGTSNNYQKQWVYLRVPLKTRT